MDTVEDKVREVLVGVLSNGMTPDEVGRDVDLVEEYGLDSLQMISFLLGIEDTFDLELDYENLELDDLRSVAQFASYVRQLAPAA
ncbi:acyl carrier protein [Kutzneria sp. CA-103260]|uniref:acyl carrier protein n=1 Tax=Kutzneria sp. CA-103260 TaxID=2802641 RepID=UPI001BA93A88|nr:acyl carrier protein [Kutzneria sp. CA-103260]QUQ68557.1 Acyl carrier protein [Kutzneria sp. CA-103260]